MKIFWPQRSEPKGFSIKNLGIKYREKFSDFSSNEIPNELLDDTNLKYIKEDIEDLAISRISIERGHWANRDFSEYRQAA